MKSTKYLEFIIDAEKGLSMDPAKIEAIRDWQVLKNNKGVLSFLGFTNFYRRLIKDYSQLTVPLHYLTRKDPPFI